MNNFFEDIKKFNAMYKLPVPAFPTLQFQRLKDFQTIIQEEVEEGEEIVVAHSEGIYPDILHLTNIADWLGDMMIYCCSEMHRYGLNPEDILATIMQSNFSKLDENGEPIYDERGKVLKGPNYWKPEPELEHYIEAAIESGKFQSESFLNPDKNKETLQFGIIDGIDCRTGKPYVYKIEEGGIEG